MRLPALVGYGLIVMLMCGMTTGVMMAYGGAAGLLLGAILCTFAVQHITGAIREVLDPDDGPKVHTF